MPFIHSEDRTLYKYKSLSNFKFFADILVNNRLYASPYFELNDPMEGQYLYQNGTLNQSIREKIKGDKEICRICSLTTNANNYLMWAHYADGAKGVLLELRIKNNIDIDVKEIEYGDLPTISNYTSAKHILKHKLSAWNYENEVRIFTSKKFVEIELLKITTGKRVDKQTFELIERMAKKINPNIIVEDSNNLQD